MLWYIIVSNSWQKECLWEIEMEQFSDIIKNPVHLFASLFPGGWIREGCLWNLMANDIARDEHDINVWTIPLHLLQDGLDLPVGRVAANSAKHS